MEDCKVDCNARRLAGTVTEHATERAQTSPSSACRSPSASRMPASICKLPLSVRVTATEALVRVAL